jgi:hypothetical protein
MAVRGTYNMVSALQDDAFDKYDEDENYMPRDEDNTEEQEVAQPQVDEILEEYEVTMNTVRDNIVNTLVS